MGWVGHLVRYAYDVQQPRQTVSELFAAGHGDGVRTSTAGTSTAARTTTAVVTVYVSAGAIQ